MEQALVEAAAYVIENSEDAADSCFIRLLRETDRAPALAEVCTHVRERKDDELLFWARSSDFASIPSSPLAYWIDPEVRGLFAELTPLGEMVDVRNGLFSGDDFRFVRTFWEVDPERIGYSVQETTIGKNSILLYRMSTKK